MDEEMKSKLRLDAIVTLVDARHVLQHLDSDECRAQIASADILLLNKSDLVSAEALSALGEQMRAMNALARVHTTVQGRIDLDEVLDVRAFDLQAHAAETPEILKEELPFEWAGLFDLQPGRYRLTLAPGPDPSIDLVLGGPGLEQPERFAAWKQASIPLYSSPGVAPGHALLPGETLWRLPVDETNGASIEIRILEAGRHVLFAQHLPEEFALTLRDAGDRVMSAAEEHRFASPHTHDDTVGSVGVALAGELDPDRFERWITGLLRTRGPDLFRTKGVLALKDKPNRFVFQGVHMLFDGAEGRPWGADEPRASELVFIGRNLDRTALHEGLRGCSA
jgi:G3E family GTPase